MLKKFVLKLKNKKVLNQLEKIEISDIAMDQYRLCVRKNKNESIDTLTNKLKRNFILGEKTNDYTSRYGNLYIFHKDNKITKIFNEKGGVANFSIDKKLKSELDYILGL